MKEFLRSRKIAIASISGSLLTVLVLAVVFFIAPTIASASSHQGAATPATSSAKIKVNYCVQYEQDLAKKLHISVSALRQDNKSTLISVLNQKVKDGKLTQIKANAIIKKVNQSAGNVCPNQLTHKHTINHAWLKKYAQNVTTLLAQGLHLNASQLTTQLKAGKKLSEIATAQNVSTSALQTLVKNTATTILKQAVSAGTLKQTRANTISASIQKHPESIQKLEVAIVKKASTR